MYFFAESGLIMTKRLAVFMALLMLAVWPAMAAAASDTRISGDVDGDGVVSAADAAGILRAAEGLRTLDAGASALADATGDMTVGRTDAAAVLLLCVGRIRSFSDLTVGGTDTLLQDRFLTKFSYLGAVRRGDNYRSGTVSVSVSHFAYAGAVCFLADIYIQHIESLRTEFGGGSYGASRESVADMAARTGALIAVNGDQYLRVNWGPLVRNGVWYRDRLEKTSDLCVLYQNGVMETFAAGKADVDALEKSAVYQSWICGPRLLDDDGAPMTKFTCPLDFTARAARCAIGYYEPGHYCLLLVDGTQNPASEGMLLEDLSLLFSELGCKAAYNLYGGASALMYASAGAVSTPYAEERSVSDILYITEPVA